MPSFDVQSTIQWQELTNAIAQTLKEVESRFDFKGVKAEIEVDRKENTVTLWSSEDKKLDSLRDVFFSKLIKRGISTLSFVDKKEIDAFGGSKKALLDIQAGISKEKAKSLIAGLKESKIKVQAQIQEDQLRVSGKNRDDLQLAIAHLKEQQSKLSIPLQFLNFRD